jgi:hypothetical protein
LRVLLNKLEQLTREIEDTIMLSGSEAFTQALSYYNSVKQAAKTFCARTTEKKR